MGDINQFQFINEQREKLSGPFLEIGSRDYGSTQDLRSLFPSDEYVGVDLSEGASVDLVLDLAQRFEAIDEALESRRFGTIFSLSVMEHCENPFVMADNMTRLLKPSGKVVLSVPFAWKFHGYPSDYWRFTAEGVKKLFPRLDWDEAGSGCWHSPKKGDFRGVDEFVGMAPLSGKYYRERGQMLQGLGADLLKGFRSLGLFRWLLGYRYLMLPTMINMVGVLREESEGER